MCQLAAVSNMCNPRRDSHMSDTLRGAGEFLSFVPGRGTYLSY